ncbi:MAG: AlpA family transcriptional regulator [Steroidobacteraceae bacterium]
MNGIDGAARLPELERWVGMSRSSIYRLEAAGEFPRRVRLGGRAVGWLRADVRAWLESRPTARADQAA